LLAQQAKEKCDISNSKTLAHILSRDFLQPVRDWIKVKVYPTSGYRNNSLNMAVGGSKHSRHLYFLAVDFTIDNKDFLIDIFEWMRHNMVDRIGELILYLDVKGKPKNIHAALHVPGKRRKIRIYRKLKSGGYMKSTLEQEEELNK
jgi:hypothetical protein